MICHATAAPGQPSRDDPYVFTPIAHFVKMRDLMHHAVRTIELAAGFVTGAERSMLLREARDLAHEEVCLAAGIESIIRDC